jgi:hypothetical protein
MLHAEHGSYERESNYTQLCPASTDHKNGHPIYRELCEQGMSLTGVAVSYYAPDHQGGVLIFINYECGPSMLEGKPYTCSLCLEPEGLVSLTGRPIPALSSGERVVTKPLVPGLLEYYEAVGLIRADQVLEVPFSSTYKSGEMRAFPENSLETVLERYPDIIGKDTVVFPLFNYPRLTETLGGYGIRVVGQPDALLTNHKGLYRESAPKFGYHVPDGGIVDSDEKLTSLVLDTLAGAPSAWLKFPTGSSGETVVRIPGELLTVETLKTKISELRRGVQDAFTKSDFGISFEEFWPEGGYPVGGLVLEADATFHGELVINMSNVIIVSEDEETDAQRPLRWNGKRVSPEGDFYGSFSIDPDELERIHPGIKEAMANQMVSIRAFLREQGSYGAHGGDTVVVRSPDGRLIPMTFEVNGRIIASHYTALVAAKVGARFYMGASLLGPREYRDFLEVEKDLKDFLYKAPGIGKVIPLGINSAVSLDRFGGQKRVTDPQNGLVLLITGDSISEVSDTLEALKEQRGIRDKLG